MIEKYMKISKEELLLQEIEKARKRLLDLTSRNRLLNYRFSKMKTVEFSDCIMNDLFSALVRDEKKMSFQSILKSNSTQSDDENEPLFELLQSDFRDVHSHDNSCIHVDLSKEDLQTKLHKISMLADSFFEEQGYSILFAAIGLIKWKETKTSITDQRAPVLLIPVELKRAGIGSPYKLSWTGDEIISNVCMIEKAKELNVSIPEFIFNEDNLDISSYFNKVRKAIEKQNWTIEEYSCLDFFSFTKFVLWKDLDIKSWPEGHSPLENRLIQKLLLPLEITQNEIFELDDFDNELDVLNVYSILDSDPSQISVIEAVKNGEDLVVEGPPGTGKSQTIANIIAEQLSNGKSVLFVSEKMAALEVVKTRLDKAGLEDYCLELHSRKANKRQFTNELSKILNLSKNRINVDMSAYSNLIDQRDHLNNYAKILKSKIGARNLTVFQLIGLKEKENRYFDKEKTKYTYIDIANVEMIDERNWSIIQRELSTIEPYASAIESFVVNPWEGTNPDFIMDSEINEFYANLNYVQNRFNEYKNIFKDLLQNYGINQPRKVKDISSINKAISLVMDITNIGSNIINNDMWETPLKNAYYILKVLESYQKVQSEFDEYKNDTAEIQEYWKTTWEFLNQTRSLYRIIECLSSHTGVKNDATLNKLSTYLSACSVVVAAKPLTRENILSSKWNDYNEVNTLISLLIATQIQYTKVVSTFKPSFLKEDNSFVIQDYRLHFSTSMRFISLKYAKAKRIIKKNLISPKLQTKQELSSCLSEVLSTFL